MGFAPGSRLGPYEVLELIGAGGMGEVYRALDTRLMRTVAVKVLPPTLALQVEWRRRFEREARLISSLAHPHICTLYDVGVQGTVDFLVMEHLEGETVAERITRGALPITQALKSAIEIAEALDHAHRHGIVHRDLKPGNVMLTTVGAKLLDFGIAKTRTLSRDAGTSGPTTDECDATTNGALVGTFRYMAPEQLQGRDADARTDLFAFGVLIYEMTTGRRAFNAANQSALIAAIVHGEPVPLSDIQPRAPRELEHLVRRCLAKNPDERWQTARDVAGELRWIAERPPEATLPWAADPRSPYHQSVTPPAGKWARTGAVLAAIAAVMAISLLGYESGAGKWVSRALGLHHAPIESIAVLPLRNLSDDPNQQYFVDGLTEALITDLSRFGVSRVISRSSIVRFKDTDKPLSEVAHALNVDALVDGSVRRAGDRVRVTAALIEGRTDRQMWADEYERSVHDVLDLQDEVARTIASQISSRIGNGRETRTTRTSTASEDKAHDLCLKGRFAWQRWTVEGAQQGIDLFKAALELDPQYPPAYSGLAEAYYGLSNVYMAPSDVMPRARAAALKAIELDERLAAPHAVLGVVKMGYDWDWQGAEQEFRRAIQLNPSDATAHQWYTTLLVSLGRFDEASREAALGQQLDPMTRMADIFAVWPQLYARHYEPATRELRRLAVLEPGFYSTHTHLGIVLLQQDQFNEAMAEFRRARELDDAAWTEGWLGHAYGVTGHRAEALRVLAELTERSKREYILPYALAIIHTGLGQIDSAMDQLEESYRRRDEQLAMLAVDPAVDVLRPNPRFQDLLRRIGLATVSPARGVSAK